MPAQSRPDVVSTRPMQFHFEKRICDRGRQGLIGTLIFALVFGAIDYYLLHQPVQIGHVVGTWFAGLLVLFVSIMTLTCLAMLGSKEAWLVQVTATELIWKTPRSIGNHNIRVGLDSLARITETHSPTGQFAPRYELETQDGERIKLPVAQTDVDIKALLNCLAAQGLNHQTQIEHS